MAVVWWRAVAGGLHNHATSTFLLKVYRVSVSSTYSQVLTNSAGGVAPSLSTATLKRGSGAITLNSSVQYNSGLGSNAYRIFSHSLSGSPTLANVYAGDCSQPTLTFLRNLVWPLAPGSVDNVAETVGDFATVHPYSQIFTLDDTNLQPIVLRAGEGLYVTASALVVFDFTAE